MQWLDFVAIVAATGAPIDAWLKQGGILEGWREWIVAWGSVVPPEEEGDGSCGSLEPIDWRPSLLVRIRARIAELLTCRFCLSFHVPVWLLLLFHAPGHWLESPWRELLMLPVYALAATRLSLLIGVWARDKQRESIAADPLSASSEPDVQ